MANIKVLAARLKQFEDGQRKNDFSKLIWRPKEGVTNIVRIVPYKFNLDTPFIELQFYYNLGGQHYLAPCTFGKPDPIQEMIETLRSSGNEADKLTAKKLEPTIRTYAPVIVRGEESKGVRYWGFGALVFKQLLTVMTNAKYGDITSVTDGRDIEVTFKKVGSKKNAQGDPLPETTILVDPTTCPAVDPNNKELSNKLKDQVDILSVFPLKTYEELKTAVDKYLFPNRPSSSGPTAIDTTPTSNVSSATPVAENIAEGFESFFTTPTNK